MEFFKLMFYLLKKISWIGLSFFLATFFAFNSFGEISLLNQGLKSQATFRNWIRSDFIPQNFQETKFILETYLKLLGVLFFE